MLNNVEVHKIDSDYYWVEVEVSDSAYPEATTVRLVIEEAPKMLRAFQEKYGAKRGTGVMLPESQLRELKAFFEEAAMAQAMHGGTDNTDLVALLPTTVLNFRYPEKTSFRKSRAARVGLFLDDAEAYLYQRQFDRAMARLEWVLLLDPDNEDAFALKIVALRTQKKMAECVPVFEAWIEAHPDDKRPRLGLGEMWLYLDQNQRADDAFEGVLSIDDKDAEALVGLAQARLRLGERPADALRRALVLARDYTIEMVETQFDFRSKQPGDLAPMTLEAVSEYTDIPLTRVTERAVKGVLPTHPPLGEQELLRFSRTELDRYVDVLHYLGLEMAAASIPKPTTTAAEDAVQRTLFDSQDLDALPSEAGAPLDESAAPEPTAPEPVTPEPTASEPATPEPTAPEPVTPEPVTPQPEHSAASKADPSTNQASATEQPFLFESSADTPANPEPTAADRTTAEQFERVDESFEEPAPDHDEREDLYNRRTRPVDEDDETDITQ